MHMRAEEYGMKGARESEGSEATTSVSYMLSLLHCHYFFYYYYRYYSPMVIGALKYQ